MHFKCSKLMIENEMEVLNEWRILALKQLEWIGDTLKRH